MQRVCVYDPEWHITFPRGVTPLPDEWLAGLLLRCDEVNQWEAGTTLAHLRRTSNNRKLAARDPSLIVPSSLDFDYLAQCLAVTKANLLATTYLPELARCYGTTSLYTKHLTEPFVFRLCPACIAQHRLLKRVFTLPHITCCHQHRVVLVGTCRCGIVLRLSAKQGLPFTCHSCGWEWEKLPRLPVTPDFIALEQHILSYYEFFFLEGTPELLERTIWFVNNLIKEDRLKNTYAITDKRQARSLWKFPTNPNKKRSYYSLEDGLVLDLHHGVFSFSSIVALLMRFNVSPIQLLVDAGLLPVSSVKKS